MTETLEIEFHRLFMELNSVELVADEILKKWHRGELTVEEQNTAALFVVRAGFLPSVFSELLHALKQDRTIPWTGLMEAIGRSTLMVEKEMVDQFLIGASAEKATDTLVASHSLDRVEPRIQKYRDESRRAKVNQLKAQKEVLLEQVSLLRNDRLIEEEESVLKKLARLFPDDVGIAGMITELVQRKAREIFNQQRQQAHEAELLEKLDRIELTPEMRATLQPVIEDMLLQAAKDPSLAYDISIAFYQMDLHLEALKAIECSPSAPPKEWLHLELLLETRRYLEAMEKAMMLEQLYTHDPEATYSVVYARARALWGLKQRDRAVELLQSIVRIRPQYRSAHSLLLKWKGLVI